MSFLLNPLTIALLLADVRASLNLTKLSLLAIVFFVSKNYMWDVESVRWSGIFFFFFWVSSSIIILWLIHLSILLSYYFLGGFAAWHKLIYHT